MATKGTAIIDGVLAIRFSTRTGLALSNKTAIKKETLPKSCTSTSTYLTYLNQGLLKFSAKVTLTSEKNELESQEQLGAIV